MLKKIIPVALGIVFLSACSTSNEVVSNKLFQKRKYQKGWHVNSTQKVDKSSDVAQVEVASNSQENMEYRTVSEESSLEVVSQNPNTSYSVIDSREEISMLEENNAPFVNNEEYVSSTENNLMETTSNGFELEPSVVVSDLNTSIESAEESKSQENSSRGAEWWMFVLCFFIPWLAVGIATDWDIKIVVFNILWAFLCGFPAIIHALIVVKREG